ncbi:MAG TPA: dolichyl-phosphate beta-glucosyltransferase [Bryobacteraceae bacterium]|nr:dolichyl-phosphate beta-glucosyltransferase [Bryobacteraceae bacterium]
MPPYLSLVLPAFNEAAAIGQTISEIVAWLEARGLTYEIIVAADGSDGTREVVREMARTNARLRAIGHPERLGKGRGVREAVALAEGEIIGYADADNKVPIEEFAKLEPWLKEFPIVTGSRAIDRSLVERRQPLYRRLGSIGFHWFMHAATGLWHITDSQCGFKFFRRDVAVNLFARQKIDGYMFDVEILALAQALGYVVKEVPIRWRDDGDSRLELVRGNLRNMRDVMRIRLLAGAAQRPSDRRQV